MLLSACSDPGNSTPPDPVEKPLGACAKSAIPTQFIVRWKDGTTSVETAPDRETFNREFFAKHRHEIEVASHDHIIQLSEPGVVTIAADHTVANQDWGQKKAMVPEAWAMGAEGDGVAVAVIDSGVDIQHKQLQGRISRNSGEAPVADGVDNDKNGLIDDIYGYDFFANSGDVSDVTGHGTHVAGIVAADSALGSVKGLAPKAKIVPLNFMNSNGEGALSGAIKAMDYAATRGAKIINASWGGAGCDLALQSAIKRLGDKGILFMAASGNGDRSGRGVNLDSVPTFPAAFGLMNQITIGASNDKDIMSGFSNYSFSLVNLVAPGEDIFSLYPGDRAAWMNGTSMATPFVSGAAALLWGYRPNATLSQVKAALLAGIDKGEFQVVTRGRLNVKKALEELAKVVAP